MSPNYRKLNDYTLEVTQNLEDAELSGGYQTVSSDYKLTRIFNFGTGQVTTLARHFSAIASDYASNHGSGTASSLQMDVQDFTALPSLYEVEMMHKKLKELKGNPPPLEDLVTTAGIGKPRAALKR